MSGLPALAALRYVLRGTVSMDAWYLFGDPPGDTSLGPLGFLFGGPAWIAGVGGQDGSSRNSSRKPPFNSTRSSTSKRRRNSASQFLAV